MRQWEGEREEKTLLRRGEMGRSSGDGEWEVVKGNWLGKRAKRIGGEGKGGGEKKGNMGGGGEVVKE